MSTRAQAHHLNGDGPAAKRAAKLWLRRQFLAQGVYDGPLRLLSLIIAVGVPLACYSIATNGVHTWWPMIIAGCTPLLVLAASITRAQIAKRYQPQPKRREHPLAPSTPRS